MIKKINLYQRLIRKELTFKKLAKAAADLKR